MKTRILLLLSFCIGMGAYAQNSTKPDKTIKPYDRCWQLDITTGANFDLIRSSDDPTAELLNTRPSVAPSLGVHVNHLFSRKVGWYANAQINFYKEQDPRQTSIGKIAEKLMDRIFPGTLLIHPSIDVGLLYRIETNRFRLYPSAGIGYNGHLSESHSYTANDDQQISYKQDPGYLMLNLGLTSNYYVTKRGFLVFRAGFQQPLQSTSVRMDFRGGDEAILNFYETSTAGRALNLSIGYGFAFGKRR